MCDESKINDLWKLGRVLQFAAIKRDSTKGFSKGYKDNYIIVAVCVKDVGVLCS